MKSLLKKSFIFVIVTMACLPAQSMLGIDLLAAEEALKVLAPSVGIGAGSAIIIPAIGAGVGLGCLFLKNKFGSRHSGVVHGTTFGAGAAVTQGLVGGAVVGAAVSPFVAGFLATGMVPGLMAITADATVKSAVIAQHVYFPRYEESKSAVRSDALMLASRVAVTSLAAALLVAITKR
jgi:hypothetical protein